MRKTSESKSLFEASRYRYRCQNLELVAFRGKVWQQTTYWSDGIRRAGGVILFQAFVWNYGNHPFACEPKGTRGKSPRLTVGMAKDGADSSVLALKAGNSAGAKGRSQKWRTSGQLACKEEP
jgi:hypothetical protein